MKVFLLILKGMAVGGANVMPGVSGATLAVIFRIYDKLIESVNNLFSNMKESLKFLVPVGIGMVLGILAVGEVVGFLLERFSMQTGGFIAGLMAGSLPFIYSLAKSSSNVRPHLWAIAIFATAVIIALAVFFQRPEAEVDSGAIVFSVGLAAHLFIGGAAAAATMVIPGISGAMILVLFGLYPIAMNTIRLIRVYLTSPADFELLGQILVVVIPLGIGIVVGILLGSKAIALLLKKFHAETYFAILGLVFGTIFAIFRDPDTYGSHPQITPWLIAFTAIAFVCGAAVSLRLGKQK